MAFCIDWTIFAKVATEQKCRRIIEAAENAIGQRFSEISIERYWKDPSLFKVDAKCCVEAATVRDAFYSIITTANGLAHRWIVNGPTEGHVWEFSGSADKGSIRVQGIESADFRSTSTFQSTAYAPSPERGGS